MKNKCVFLVLGVVCCFVFIQCKVFKNNSETRKVITVLGNIDDMQGDYLLGCFAPFEEETGIKIEYMSNVNFESAVYSLIEEGNPPDVAMFPQPGGAYELAMKGDIVKLDSKTQANILKNYSEGWIEIMTFNDSLYGVVHSVNIKSLVYYPKKAWDKAGWKIPGTWEELEELCKEMKAKGEVPWAVGIESGTTTGWVATDWMEDIMLRTAGPYEYDQWIAHELPFNSDELKRSAKLLADMWFTDGYVYGGPLAIPTIPLTEAANVLFDDPPGAWMHKQGNFVISFFPERIRNNIDEEVGFFLFPQIDRENHSPILGGGLIFYAFDDRPEVHSFMHYISTGKSGEAWAKTGGALFAHKDQDLSVYPNDLSRKLARIMMETETFRFDASDRMPPQVGSGAFWYEMVEYIQGKDITQVLADIDEEWP